jgi:hypothetical protein
MPDQLDKQIKAGRAKVVREIVAAKKTAFLQWLVDSATQLDVVLQSGQTRSGISQFYTECHFPLLPFGAGQRDIVRGVATAVRKRGLVVRPL